MVYSMHLIEYVHDASGISELSSTIQSNCISAAWSASLEQLEQISKILMDASRHRLCCDRRWPPSHTQTKENHGPLMQKKGIASDRSERRGVNGYDRIG
jgi:hypothetical protein